ncbi:MAG: amidohydrolase family protein [Pyrinomonadaceae bacterium]
MKKHFLRFSAAIFAFMLFGISATAQTDVYAITNAKIVTVSGDNILRGTVVIRDGLIEAVGSDAKVPADARVFDGNGLTVYPGLFDTITEAGIRKSPPPSPGQNTQSQSNSNYPEGLQPGELVSESLKAGEDQFENYRNNGITTVLTVNNSGIFQGQSAVINLAGETVSSMIIRSPFAEHVSFTTIRGSYPGSLMGTFAALRQMFLDAKRLDEIQKMYASNPRGMRRPESDPELEALIPVINGKMPIVFNADSERQIIRAIDLAKEFKLNAIIAGALESHKVADRLKDAKYPVLLSMNLPKRTTAEAPDADPEPMTTLRLRAEAPKNAAKLIQAGVKFGFQTDGLKNLGEYLSNVDESIKNGLSEKDAIRALTLSPAEILGVSDQLGSIDKGKIANLVVTKGDLFSKDRTITHVFVDGKYFEQPEKKERKPAGPGTTGAAGTIAQVGGRWSISVDAQGQLIPAVITFSQTGENLTGTLGSDLFGSVPISNGKASAKGFSFNATVSVGGAPLDVSFIGNVTGNKVEGTVGTPQGPATFTGTKIP